MRIYSGNGYISQPRTTADARKPPNISAAEAQLIARRRPWRSPRTPATRRTRNSEQEQQVAAALLPPHRDVVRVDDHQHVQQAGDDQERVAVLVGDRPHVAGAVAERAGDEVGRADAEIGERRERRPADRTSSNGNRRPRIARPIANISGSATRKISPFDRRPSHRWPAPGIAHDARHNSTSVPDCVSSAAVARTAVSLPDYPRPPRPATPRRGRSERRRRRGSRAPACRRSSTRRQAWPASARPPAQREERCSRGNGAAPCAASGDAGRAHGAQPTRRSAAAIAPTAAPT